MFKKTLFFFTCILLFSAFLPFCKKSKEPANSQMPPLSENKPELHLEKTNYNLGKIHRGEKPETIITLSNKGNVTLKVEDISCTCGCKVEKISGETILPGKDLKLNVTLESNFRKGQFLDKLTLKTNDPKQPEAFINFQGHIFEDLEISPDLFHFGRVAKNKSALKEFSLKPADNKIKISSVTVNKPDLFYLEKLQDETNADRYQLKFRGHDILEPVKAELTIKYSGSSVSSITRDINVNVVSDISYPELVIFYKIKDAFTERNIKFSSRSDKKIIISNPEDHSGLLDLKIITENSESVLVATVKNKDTEFDSEESHRLTVHTNDPDLPIAEITYKLTDRGIFRRNMPLSENK